MCVCVCVLEFLKLDLSGLFVKRVFAGLPTISIQPKGWNRPLPVVLKSTFTSFSELFNVFFQFVVQRMERKRYLYFKHKCEVDVPSITLCPKAREIY